MGQHEKSEKNRRFAEAIHGIRLRQGITQAELANKIDVAASAVANWERGANGPSNRTLLKIAKALGVSIDFLTGVPETSMAELREAPSAHYNVRHLGRAPRGGQRIPVISFTRAGAPDFDYSDLDAQMDEAIESDIKDPNSFGLVVEGDSMEPKISAGDVVVVAPNDRPRNGDLVVARLAKTEGVMLKIFNFDGETIRLSSYNPAYTPLTFKEADFVFMYPVHSRLTRWRR